ncbi:hypothetical protein V8D89_002210 [Ganoderma adspersum]
MPSRTSSVASTASSATYVRTVCNTEPAPIPPMQLPAAAPSRKSSEGTVVDCEHTDTSAKANPDPSARGAEDISLKRASSPVHDPSSFQTRSLSPFWNLFYSPRDNDPISATAHGESWKVPPRPPTPFDPISRFARPDSNMSVMTGIRSIANSDSISECSLPPSTTATSLTESLPSLESLPTIQLPQRPPRVWSSIAAVPVNGLRIRSS